MSANHKSDKTEKAIHKQPKKDSKVRLIVLLVILALVGLIAVLQSNSNTPSKKEPTKSTTVNTSSQGNAKLYIKPASQNVTVGSAVVFEVWVDTGGQPVNAVQANLTYPVDKFDFSSINTKGSAFEVQALSTGGNGKISLGRGHIGEVKGAGLVAKITLTAKSNKGDADVEFAAGSAVVRSTDHKDILHDKLKGSFKVSKDSAPLTEQRNKVG
jgi:hypothetical protein